MFLLFYPSGLAFLFALLGTLLTGFFLGALLNPFNRRQRSAGIPALEPLPEREERHPEPNLREEGQGPQEPHNKEWMQQLQEVVERRLGDFDLKAEDIAQELSMSRTQFFRRIKKETGLTPAQYLEDARFRQAIVLLESGAVESVKALAFEVGFKHVKYFSRLFKERFGKSPSELLGKD